MPRHPQTPESSQSIPEMVDELTREEIATWYKGGKLTPHGKQMAKFLDRAFPAEKVDEWCFLLTRKEIEAIKREAEEKKRLASDYQYYLSCSELHVETMPASQQAQARQGWAKILRPFASSPSSTSSMRSSASGPATSTSRRRCPTARTRHAPIACRQNRP